jgi:hypothetical protein
MKKLFMFLCIGIMFFGIVGCPGDDEANPVAPKSFKSTPVAAAPSDPGPSTVPEPATLVMLGSGLVGFAVFGRNKVKK